VRWVESRRIAWLRDSKWDIRASTTERQLGIEVVKKENRGNWLYGKQCLSKIKREKDEERDGIPTRKT
jgi:hypothetical protein